VQSGFQDWAGGSGTCASRPTSGPYQLCPSNDAPHALPWGSAEFIGLGFLVYVTIILSERFGSPIMKSCAVVVGLLVGCIVAAACGYFSDAGITAAPPASFIWVHTFELNVYAPIILPLLAVYIVLMMEGKFSQAPFVSFPLLPSRLICLTNFPGSNWRHHRNMRCLPPRSSRRPLRLPHPRWRSC
jgi:xanthine/uracil permease